MIEMRFVLRVLSATLILTGLSLVAAGLETPLQAALNCVQGAWIQPAECTAAHVEPAPDERVSGGESGCKFENGACSVVGDGCSSDPHFNNARKGTCQAYIGGSEIYQCAEDFFKTGVTLTKVIGVCDNVNGDCGCKYSAAMPAQTMNVEVCNCEQEQI